MHAGMRFTYLGMVFACAMKWLDGFFIAEETASPGMGYLPEVRPPGRHHRAASAVGNLLNVV